MVYDFEIIDVTLRDGGYTNKFDFKNREIEQIISSLQKTKIE